MLRKTSENLEAPTFRAGARFAIPFPTSRSFAKGSGQPTLTFRTHSRQMTEHRQILAQDLQPFPTTTEDRDRFRWAAAELLGAEWLAEDGQHRLQRLWRRTDELALLEQASLGHAIEALGGHDKWLRDAARAIRRQPDGGHGHIFEIMLLGGLAAAGARVTPAPARTAGHDAWIELPGRHVLRASIRNHDLSSHEASFRASCRELDAVVREHVGSSGGVWSVIASSRTPMTKRTLNALANHIAATPLEGAGRHVRLLGGEATLQTTPLGFAGALPPSYQLLVRSPAHAREQSNFRSKLIKALNDFASHSSVPDTYSNVVFMRVHATADVSALRHLAAELLAEPGCVVEAVYFMQSAVAREERGTAVTHYMPAVTTERYRQRGVKLRVMTLAGLAACYGTALQLQSSHGALADLSGQYVFQRGHLYYGAGACAWLASLQAPAGMQVSAYGSAADGGVVSVVRPEDEELTVL